MPTNEFKTNLVNNPVTVSVYVQEFTVAGTQPPGQSFNRITNDLDRRITNDPFDIRVTNDE